MAPQFIFLIDMAPDPFHRDRRTVLPRAATSLPERVRRLRPRRVVLVGADVYDSAFPVLRDAGLPVVDVRLPYPGSGQQRRFAEGFARVIHGGQGKATA